jgi:hypothetical protein
MTSLSKNKTLALSAKKLLEDKKMVRAYLRGEKSIKDLNDKGIRLAMPL